ncbi:MAG: hypothetical protein GX303_04850 [Clostridiales bacterium]|nr:hypothetical protein [Clostridiales bacterium]
MYILILGGEGYGAELIDIPFLIYLSFKENSEYVASFIQNILMGLLFAGLGVFGIFQKVSKEVKVQKIAVSDLPDIPESEKKEEEQPSDLGEKTGL